MTKIYDFTDNIFHKVLDEIKKIMRIKKFDDTKILIEADDKLLMILLLKMLQY